MNKCTWFECKRVGVYRRTPNVLLCEQHSAQFDKAWTANDIQEAVMCAQARHEAGEVIAKAMYGDRP